MRMREGRNKGEVMGTRCWMSVGRKETQALGRLGKARYPPSSSSEGKRGGKRLQKLKKRPNSEPLCSASFRGFSWAGGQSVSGGASRGSKPESQAPRSDVSPGEGSSKLSSVI